MFPLVAYVFFFWLLLVGARENGVRWASVMFLLGAVLLAGALLAWYPPFVLTIGVSVLGGVMVLMMWGVEPWST